jgi:hypothetical protein
VFAFGPADTGRMWKELHVSILVLHWYILHHKDNARPSVASNPVVTNPPTPQSHYSTLASCSGVVVVVGTNIDINLALDDADDKVAETEGRALVAAAVAAEGWHEEVDSVSARSEEARPLTVASPEIIIARGDDRCCTTHPVVVVVVPRSYDKDECDCDCDCDCVCVFLAE